MALEDFFLFEVILDFIQIWKVFHQLFNIYASFNILVFMVHHLATNYKHTLVLLYVIVILYLQIFKLYLPLHALLTLLFHFFRLSQKFRGIYFLILIFLNIIVLLAVSNKYLARFLLLKLVFLRIDDIFLFLRAFHTAALFF